MYCKNCNHEFSDSAKFCPCCGMNAASMKKDSVGSNFELGSVSAAVAEEKDLIQNSVSRAVLIPDYTPVPTDEADKPADKEPEYKPQEENSDRYETVPIEDTYETKNIVNRYNDTYGERNRRAPHYDSRTPVRSSRAEKSVFSEYKPLIITLITVIILSAAFLILYFTTNIFGVKASDCAICKTQVEDGGKYCAECSVKYWCEGCETIDAGVEGGFCKNCLDSNVCKSCREYFDELEEGYCENCIDDYTCIECGDVCDEIEENYCDKCVKNFTCKACKSIDESVEKGYCLACREELTCKDCKTISMTTVDGYCEKCIEEHICKGCDKVVEVLDKGYCEDCVKNHICLICCKYKDNLVNGYCDDCHDAYNCKKCGKIDISTKENGICEECKNNKNSQKLTCNSCNKETEAAKSYKDSNGKYYCASCVTGYYCSKCKAPVSSGRKLCKDCQ